MRVSRAHSFLLTAGLAGLLVAGARPGAQAPPQLTFDAVLDTLDRVLTIRETAISPDGQRVAWVMDAPGAVGGGTSIWVRELPDGDPHLLTAGSGVGFREHGIAWSPDGKSLAFLSDAGGRRQLQLYIAAIGDAPGVFKRSRLVTPNAAGQLAHPIWSPDGKQISLLYVEGSTQETGALVAYKPDAGVVGDAIEEQRIAVVAAAGGPLRAVSPANLFVYDYDWSPDGKSFAAEAVEGSGTDNYWTAQLYTVDAGTGAARSIWKPPFQIAWPRWSPDGKYIAVIHGLMSDEGATGGDVYVVPAVGGGAKNVTPGLEGSARSLEWRLDGRILFNEWVDNKSALVTVAATGGRGAMLWSSEQQYTAVSLARQTNAVSLAIQSFREPAEVYAGEPGKWTRQTGVNAYVKPMWGDARSLHWKSDLPAPARFAGTAVTNQLVQGWLLCPAGAAPGQKFPLVVAVHGGPSSAVTAAWPSRWSAVLPTQGYCVLMPNPRGSYGNGEAFTQANIKDFGYGDLHDILGGVDAAVAQGPIDANRVGIIGWSYGGYMAMWAVTQTNRFKAAVAGAGIANWQSYYGQNKIDQWMLPFFGASVYDDPDIYARSSPIAFIKKTKTPTLVLHGDRDSEVPTPQGYEFWHALKALGVPTELVIYPDEGHAIAKPEHQHDIQKRLVAWFDKYLH
jgi:dipeptidyl aminopeptidase/acylaminoacyl peptidase